MREGQSLRIMPSPKSSPIDRYLADITHPQARKTLARLRAQLRKLLPRATEIISYGMPAFRLEDGKVAAGFAFFGKNCGYYPHSGNIVSRLTALTDLLDGYKTSSGGVRFPPDRPLPLAVVKALVAARLDEVGQSASPARSRERAKLKPSRGR